MIKRLLICLSMFELLGSTFLPATALAIPAWGRKYGTSCSLCHYPNVPRLNSYGQRYRRAGFRTEGEINKDQEITNVGNFLSVRGRLRYQADFQDHGATTNDFRLNDITLFYAGTLSKHFSAFTESEVAQDGDWDVLATAHGIYGEWGNFATIRLGQMHTLTRVGWGGLDRPTGITTPAPLSAVLTSGGVPFKLNEDQKGLELTYVYNDSRVIAQVLNGVNIRGGVAKGRSGTDDDQEKDIVLAFEQIIDDIASGFTVFGYRGVAHFDPTTGGVAKGPANRYEFYRFGATANKVFDSGFEIQGGYVRAEDSVPNERGRDISGNSFYVQAEQYLQSLGLTFLGRYDYVNPRLGHSEDEVHTGTLGAVATLEEYVRVALEASLASHDDTAHSKRRGNPGGPTNFRDLNDTRLLAEVMFNF
jgi:hypothetical protein